MATNTPLEAKLHSNQPVLDNLVELYEIYKETGDVQRRKACGRAITTVLNSSVHLQTFAQS